MQLILIKNGISKIIFKNILNFILFTTNITIYILTLPI